MPHRSSAATSMSSRLLVLILTASSWHAAWANQLGVVGTSSSSNSNSNTQSNNNNNSSAPQTVDQESSRELWSFAELFGTDELKQKQEEENEEQANNYKPQMKKWVQKNQGPYQMWRNKWNMNYPPATPRGGMMWTMWKNNNGMMWNGNGSWQSNTGGGGGGGYWKPNNGWRDNTNDGGGITSGGLWDRKKYYGSSASRDSAPTGTWSGTMNWRNMNTRSRPWSMWKQQYPRDSQDNKPYLWGPHHHHYHKSSKKSMKSMMWHNHWHKMMKSMKSSKSDHYSFWDYGAGKGFAPPGGKGVEPPTKGKGKGKGKGFFKGRITNKPTPAISLAPSVSAVPSQFPSESNFPSEFPSVTSGAPSVSVQPSQFPSESNAPSQFPSVSNAPSISVYPSMVPTTDGAVFEKFETTLQLRMAVDLYMVSEPTAIAFYGPIERWNVTCITDFSDLFSVNRNPLAVNFNKDLGAWDLSHAETTESMFKGAAAFNQGISRWNVSSVVDFSSMFESASTFNQNLPLWNVKKAVSFASMFKNANSFNGLIATWDVTNAEDFSSMFHIDETSNGVSSFNQNLPNWTPRQASTMASMFEGATIFNGNIASWNVARNEDFSGMFKGAAGFNQDISSWQVGKGKTFESMFEGALTFDQDLSPWDVQSALNMKSMFEMAFFFSQNLCPWASVLPKRVDLQDIFVGSGCPVKTDPVIVQGEADSFCAPCGTLVPSISVFPSQAPSVSHHPSVSVFPSTVPSLSSFPSSAPSFSSGKPSTSNAPSLFPSTSSGRPSTSSAPSLFPSVSNAPSEPIGSAEPSTSVAPSQFPSASNAPSQFPSVSHAPSQFPSVSNAPSVSSAEPSTSLGPSQYPTVSAAPSSPPTQSTRPSQAPSTSVAPSSRPTLSIQPSQAPSTSVAPSSRPTTSSQPSLQPSESSKPTAAPTMTDAPSQSIAPSENPTVSQAPSVSLSPTSTPSLSISPSSFPSSQPTLSNAPTSTPTFSPTESAVPSLIPSQFPSSSLKPSMEPSSVPTSRPTINSAEPSLSLRPSGTPSSFPSSSLLPSSFPSLVPSTSSFPSIFPSLYPSVSNAPSEVLVTGQRTEIEWEQTAEYFGFEDGELFGVSLSISDDGNTFLAGAYEHSSEFSSGGRIEMIDTEFELGIEALGQADNDAFGFSVSMSGNTETVAAIRTSDGVLEVFDENFNLRQEIDAGFVSFTAVFRVSRDGNWIVIAGDEQMNSRENAMKARVYQFDETSLLFVQYGKDIEIQTNSDFGSYMIDTTDDGSQFVVTAIGDMQFGQTGSFWVFERKDSSEKYVLMGEQVVSKATNDGFGQSVNIAVTDDDQVIIAIGIPFEARVVVFMYTDGSWVVHVEIDAGPEYNPDSDFGYAVSLSRNGSRIAIGARCYAEPSSDGCDGAVQAYDILGQKIFPAGSILAGPPFSFFGEAVAISSDGTAIAVGAPEDCIDSECSGSVYLFVAREVEP